uniref:DNA/RNA-binding protein Alba-like domain-containing protein n=1 Tax=Trypanosoma vivax (strain Y486) TaxID=1055687 RepID=G0UAY6_TRYVY|nr:conserved hypothetical protein [Trypanosoma vivax Y486]
MSCKEGRTEDPTRLRVSRQRRYYIYLEFVKHRFHDGVTEIIVSGLGQAISDAVAVAEILKNQGLITVKRITTSQGRAEPRTKSVIHSIEILIEKAPNFDSIYDEQQRRKTEKKERVS